ncbi:ATP-binding protein [Deferribacteres bacterium DY0609]|nr:ATP-binding protein [Denitrovibrio acetiphilus]
MKIRNRIISYVFASCAVVVAIFSFTVYYEMRELLMMNLDSEIRHIRNTLQDEIESSDRSLADILSDDEYSYFLIWVDGGGSVQVSPAAAGVEKPSSEKTRFLKKMVFNNNPKVISEYYRFNRKVLSIKGADYEVLTGIPIKKIEEELGEIIRTFFIAAFLSLLFIGGAGVLISNSILRPVKNIIKSSNIINSKNLSLRIDNPDTNDEIDELITTLNKLFERLERAFEMQSEFIANISHEIKTPLAVIGVLTDEELQSESLTDGELEYLNKINYNLSRINKLTRDLINLSYIETKDVELSEKVDFVPAINEILDNFSEMIADKNLNISCSFEDVLITGNSRLIYSAISNLIHNAVKYNVRDGYIDIRTKASGGKVEFVISNSCVHVSDENINRLFDRFYRVEKSRSREYGGAGLGLSIVKEIVLRHGGTVYADRHGDTGISFTLIL